VYVTGGIDQPYLQRLERERNELERSGEQTNATIGLHNS
jgi:hypothetical protein